VDAGQPLATFSDFAKEYVDEALCSRLLEKHGGDVQRSIGQLRKILAWRESNKDLLTKRQCRRTWDLRVIGADQARRPMLYCCFQSQTEAVGRGSVEQFVVNTLAAIDNMPPGVETATHIWDMHGMKWHLNLNPAGLLGVVDAIEGYFVGRLHKMVIIEMPGFARFLKEAVWPLLPARTKQKVLFMSYDEAAAHMRRECDAKTAERVLGAMARNRDPQVSSEDLRRACVSVNPQGEEVPVFM